MPQSLFDLAKRAAEVLGVMAVIYGAAVGSILAFGGHVPPWMTVAQAGEMQQQFEQYKAEQLRTDRIMQSNLDLLTLQGLRDKARTADAKARANPGDSQAGADAWFAQKSIEVFYANHPELAKAFVTE